MASAKKKSVTKNATKALKKPPKKPAAKKSPKKPAAKKPPKKPAAKQPSKQPAAKKPSKKPAAKKPAAKKPAKKPAKKVAGVTLSGTRHDPPVFLLVHIPLGLQPFERAERFEDPLDEALGQHGAVSGGGTSISEDGVPESCDVELEVSDVIRALPIMRRVLVEQGAPPGTVVTRLSRTGEFEVLLSIES